MHVTEVKETRELRRKEAKESISHQMQNHRKCVVLDPQMYAGFMIDVVLAQLMCTSQSCMPHGCCISERQIARITREQKVDR